MDERRIRDLFGLPESADLGANQWARMPGQEKKMTATKVTPCAVCRELVDENEVAIQSFGVAVCQACADDAE